MKIAAIVISCFVFLVVPQFGWAGDCSPLQLSFTGSYQIVSADKDVCGLRLNLPVGDNVNIYGLDLGVMGVASESKMGIMLNLFSNYNSGGSTKGIQIGGMGNVQFIPDMQGIQIAGLFNVATSVRGIQIGLINGTQELSGLQIGLINYIGESPVPILPIINLKF
jgi:hypothetical protein